MNTTMLIKRQYLSTGRSPLTKLDLCVKIGYNLHLPTHTKLKDKKSIKCALEQGVCINKNKEELHGSRELHPATVDSKTITTFCCQKLRGYFLP